MKKSNYLILVLLAVLFIVPFGVKAAAIYDHEVIFDMNGGDYVHQDIDVLGSKLLNASEPVVLLVEGDSTGDAAGEWVYDSFETLGVSVPAYSIQYRLWDSATTSYKTNTNFQYGEDGDAYAKMFDTSGSYLSTLDSSDLSITGDLDLRAKVRMDAGSTGSLISKQQSYFWTYTVDALGTTGQMTLYHSELGTVNITTASGGFAVINDADIWLRVTLDVDNGAVGHTVTFYKSDDGVTWSTILAVTTAAVTSIYDSTNPVELGGKLLGATYNFDGRYYAAEIRNGINGTVVASPDLDIAFPSSINSFLDVEGNYWVKHGDVEVGHGSPGILVLNGSMSGATTETFTSTVLNNLVKIEPDMLFINLAHNENDNDSYVDEIENFVDANLTMYSNTSVVLILQNEHVAPRTTAQILAQKIRLDQVKLVAARNDYAFIDVTTPINSDTTSYISADGLHPTTAGYEIWTDTVVDYLRTGLSGGVNTLKILVEDAKLIVEPNNPTKDDATFLGWYTNESLTDEWNFDVDQVQDDMTLYALYSDSVVSPSIGVSIFAPAGDTFTIFGFAWYWYAIIGVGAYGLFGTKKGRKAIGLK